ncbi:hypothetical protein, partial [Mycobacteroides abscessus]|uniref:hypothetical protein n=1 Tax=Mycobacteroides abscessus TaxID=36809 RepID=UPI001A9753FC
HDRHVRLADPGVPTDVLEALAEREEERVEHVRGQEHLAGAVPADLEAHPTEALLDRLEGLAEGRLLFSGERVVAGLLRLGRRAEAEVAEEPSVLGGLLPHGLLGHADS